MRRLFEGSEEGLGIFFSHCGGFGRHYFFAKILGKVVGVRFVDLYLEGSSKTIRCAMYLERQSIYLRTRYDV
jgi:hypothetical protein